MFGVNHGPNNGAARPEIQCFNPLRSRLVCALENPVLKIEDENEDKSSPQNLQFKLET
jgi:hypothetical protein